MSKSSPAASRPLSLAASSDTKSPRGHLTRLRVEAAHCPEMLPRMLGLVAQQGLVPLSIDYENGHTRLLVILSVDGLDSTRGLRLLRAVEAIVSVWSAELLDSEGIPICTSAFPGPDSQRHRGRIASG